MGNHRRKPRIITVLSVLLAAVLFITLMPMMAMNVKAKELTGSTVNVFSITPNTGEISKSQLFEYKISLLDFNGEDGDRTEKITEGEYTYATPANLSTSGTQNISFIYPDPEFPDDSTKAQTITIGSAVGNGTSTKITFTTPSVKIKVPSVDEDGNPTGEYEDKDFSLDYVTEAGVGIGATLAENPTYEASTGKVEIEIPGGTTVSFIVNELKPSSIEYPAITKNAGAPSYDIDSNEITWTIVYTPYKDGTGNPYTGAIPAKLVDTLDSKLEYVENSATGVTGVAWDPTENTLTYTIPNPTQGFTLTYKTKVKESEKELDDFVGYWQGDSPAFKANNGVKLLDADGNLAKYNDGSVDHNLEANGTTNITADNKPQATSKSGRITKAAAGGYQGYIDWSVTIDPKVLVNSTQGFSQFVLKDTLGDALVSDSIPSAKVGSTNISSTNSGQVVTFDLTSYINGANSKAPFTLNYRTYVKDDYFNYAFSDSDLNNTAVLLWTLPNSGKTGNATSGDSPSPNSGTVNIGPSNLSGVMTSPIAKEKEGSYDEATRRFRWKVTVGSAGVNFKEIHLTDLPSTNQSFVGSISGTNTTKELAVSAVKSSIANNDGISDSDVTVAITKIGAQETMTIDIVPAGGSVMGPVVFYIDTYLIDPIGYAGNNEGRNESNVINLLGTSKVNVAGGGTKDMSPKSATATQPANGKITKKYASSYNPETNRVTWTIIVNERKAGLNELKLRDDLPDGLKYVPGTAKIKLEGGTFGKLNDNTTDYAGYPGPNPGYVSGINLYVKDKTNKNLNFVFDSSISGKTYEITFETDLVSKEYLNTDTGAPASIAIDNKVYSYVEDPGNTGKWLADNKQTATGTGNLSVPNEVINKEKTALDGNKVTYTVVVNPQGMKLLADDKTELWLEDTMADGLVIDEESVQVFAAKRKPVADNTDPNGTMTIPVAKNAVEKDGSALTLQTEVVADGDNTKLRIKINDNTPYIVTYDAYIVKKNTALTNNVKLFGSFIPSKENVSEKTVSAEFTSSSYAMIRLPKRLTTGPTAAFMELSIKKVKLDGTALPGATFTLYKTEADAAANTDPVAAGTTDAQGEYSFVIPKETFGGTIPAKVYIKETAAPSGYEANDMIYELETASLGVVEGEPDLKVPNRATGQTDGKVSISKKEEGSSTVLKGAIFGIYLDKTSAENETSEKMVFQGTTDENGKLVVSGLTEGTKYFIKELAAPTGYVKSTTVYEAEAKVSIDASDIVVVENAKSSDGNGTGNPDDDDDDTGTGDPDNSNGTNPVPGPNPDPIIPGPGPGPVIPGPNDSSTGGVTPPANTTPTPDKPKDETTDPIKPESETQSEEGSEEDGIMPLDPGETLTDPDQPLRDDGTPIENPVRVDFVTDHGESPDTQIHESGDIAQNPGAPLDLTTLQPGDVIDGWRFEGWFLDPEFTVAYDFNTPLTDDIVLYAKWTDISSPTATSPKTGDASNMWLYLLLAAVLCSAACGGILGFSFLRRR